MVGMRDVEERMGRVVARMARLLAGLALAGCGGQVAEGSCCAMAGAWETACTSQEPWLYSDGRTCLEAAQAPLGTACVWCPPSGGGRMWGEVVGCGR